MTLLDWLFVEQKSFCMGVSKKKGRMIDLDTLRDIVVQNSSRGQCA